MSKTKEKVEKKSEIKEAKKVEVKKVSSFKKKSKIKKILPQVLHTFTQLLIIQLFQSQMKVEMLFLGLQRVQKVLKDQGNQLHMLHK